MIASTNTAKEERQLTVIAGILTYDGRIYIPAIDSVHGKVISLFHDNSESGYFGALKSTELICRDFYWPVMDSRVSKYVSSCKVCHQIKPPRHARHGIDMPLETPSQPSESVTMDFVTDLPESTASHYTMILIIVDRLTKMATYLLCWKDIDSPELARLIVQHVIIKRSVPDNIVTDRGNQFSSRLCTRVCSDFSSDHRLSTAIHPQTDRQTNCQEQTMEQYLLAFCNYKQNNWLELLPLAEFAYNNMIHPCLRMTQGCELQLPSGDAV